MLCFFFFLILNQGHSLIAFRERNGERKKGKEKVWCNREAPIGCLPYTPDQGSRIPGPGIKSASQVCCLIENLTHNPLVRGRCSNQQSHTDQGNIVDKSEQKYIFI